MWPVYAVKNLRALVMRQNDLTCFTTHPATLFLTKNHENYRAYSCQITHIELFIDEMG